MNTNLLPTKRRVSTIDDGASPYFSVRRSTFIHNNGLNRTINASFLVSHINKSQTRNFMSGTAYTVQVLILKRILNFKGNIREGCLVTCAVCVLDASMFRMVFETRQKFHSHRSGFRKETTTLSTQEGFSNLSTETLVQQYRPSAVLCFG